MIDCKDEYCKVYRARIPGGRSIRAVVVPGKKDVEFVVDLRFSDVEWREYQQFASELSAAWHVSIFTALQYLHDNLVPRSYEMSCMLSQALKELIPLPSCVINHEE